MADKPYELQFLARRKDAPPGEDIQQITLTYDTPDEHEFALREAERYLEEHDMVRVKAASLERPGWAIGRETAYKVKREAQAAADRAKRRVMGEDYDIYDFNDFNLGPELEKLISPPEGSDPDGTIYHDRAEIVLSLLRDCFERMRIEGEWDMCWGADNKDGPQAEFTYRPDTWSDFWDLEFPFVLDFRPADVLPIVRREVRQLTALWGDARPDDEHSWDGQSAESITILRTCLERWRDVFSQSIQLVDRHSEICRTHTTKDAIREDELDRLEKQEGSGDE